jgi:hypothetical protein
MTHCDVRAIVAFLISCLALAGCSEGPPYFISGTATLPACQEPPAFDLTGEWFDTGTVTIETTGCSDAEPDDQFQSCALNWLMTQNGSDIEILVDNEYRILGRLCGEELYLEGGWWLPVEDAGMCTYDDDSAEEVGIQEDGNVLTVTDDPVQGGLVAAGTLRVQGPCAARYAVTLFKL